MQKVILTLWDQYLERCQVDQFKMPADQHREMKRAFFGAAGQVLIYMRDDVGAQGEEKAAAIFQAMLDEVQVFWSIEVVTQDAETAANPKQKPDAPKTFTQELTALVNRYSKENGSNTPDYVLANFLQNSLAAFDLAVNQRADHGEPDLVTRIKNKMRDAGKEIMDEIEGKTAPTAKDRAKVLRDLMNSPYGAALGKNAPEITVGLKFLNEHQPGQLYTVVKVDTEKNSIDVGIEFQDRVWTDTGWDLQHTIWGFERGEYWEVPRNTILIKVMEAGRPGQAGKYAIQTPGVDREVADAIVDRHLEKMRNREFRESPHALDEKGFFFYLKTGGIGWCRMYGGTPWFMAQTADGQWYTAKQINQTDVWNAKASEVSAEEDAALRKTIPNE
jgi:hypothetical protein